MTDHEFWLRFVLVLAGMSVWIGFIVILWLVLDYRDRRRAHEGRIVSWCTQQGSEWFFGLDPCDASVHPDSAHQRPSVGLWAGGGQGWLGDLLERGDGGYAYGVGIAHHHLGPDGKPT